MTDTSDPLPREPRDGEELLYDFFKHMTSLSLVTLGGVITLSQMRGIQITSSVLVTVVVLVAAAGIAAFAGMDEVVKARFDRKDVSKRIRFYRRICPLAFGLGIGGFLSVFLQGVS